MSWIPVLVRLPSEPGRLTCAPACDLCHHLLGSCMRSCSLCFGVASSLYNAVPVVDRHVCALVNVLTGCAAGNFKLFAEREVPIELRTEAGTLANDAGSVEAVRVRLLVCGSQPDLEAVRVC